MEVLEKKVGVQRYSEYKDSGADWLGCIPSNWDYIKMKYLFRDISIKNKPKEELLSVTQDQGVVPRTWVNNRMVMPSGSLGSFKYIEKGDFAISLRSFEGGLEHCHHDGIISPAYTVLKAQEDFDNHFFKYLFKSKSFISELQTSVVGIREGKNISFSELSYSMMPVPPKSEQTAIANFLDRKTAQIDQAVEIKQKQIELLKERRQILIHKAVTQGLNPDVPLKSSGVEWIGEIPEHWEVKRLAAFGRFSKGGGISRSDLKAFGLPAILYGDIYTKYNISCEQIINKISEETSKNAKKISKGTLLFAGSGETIEDIGKCIVYVNDKPAFTGGDIIVFEQSTYDSLFLSYSLNSEGIKHEKAKTAKGEIIVHTYASKLKELRIPIPPIQEQKEISEYLNNVSQKIFNAIKLKNIEIEKLKEYKTSLINSAVTGKIKVS